MGRRYHLHPHLGRIHLSSNRHGLLLEKDHRLCDRREYAHPACCRGFTHGSQKSTPYRGRDHLPFRCVVHTYTSAELRRRHEHIWYPRLDRVELVLCYDNAAAESFNTLKFIHSYGQPGSDEGFHRPSATHE